MDRLAVELLFLFLSLPFSLLNYSYGSDQWKRNERKWKGMLWTPSSGSYFSFLFSLLRCWLQPKILSMVWHNITVLSWSRNQTMASFIHFILPVQGARPLLFLCENRELQKRREKKEILKPFAEALQTYGRFLRNLEVELSRRMEEMIVRSSVQKRMNQNGF